MEVEKQAVPAQTQLGSKKRKREQSSEEKAEKKDDKKARKKYQSQNYDGWFFMGVQGEEKRQKVEAIFPDENFPEGAKRIWIDGKLVSLKESEEQKAERKRLYRAEYRQRPDVIKKKEEKNNSEATKRMRKEYSSQPDVKDRKSIQGKQKRALLRKLKIENPSTYRALLKEVEQKLPTPKISTKRKTQNGKKAQKDKESDQQNEKPNEKKDMEVSTAENSETDTSQSSLSTSDEY